MMVIRLILLTLAVGVVLWLLKRLLMTDTQSSDEQTHKAENMLACHYCGTHIPESLTVTSDHRSYCCQDHADRDRA